MTKLTSIITTDVIFDHQELKNKDGSTTIRNTVRDMQNKHSRPIFVYAFGSRSLSRSYKVGDKLGEKLQAQWMKQLRQFWKSVQNSAEFMTNNNMVDHFEADKGRKGVTYKRRVPNSSLMNACIKAVVK